MIIFFPSYCVDIKNHVPLHFGFFSAADSYVYINIVPINTDLIMMSMFAFKSSGTEQNPDPCCIK